MKISALGLLLLLALPAGIAAAHPQQPAPQQSAQRQDDSLVAAANRARERKKGEPAKPPKVWDNDNIPKNPGALSIIGSSAPPAGNAAASGATESKPQAEAAAAPAKDAATQAAQKQALEKELADAKENIQSLQTDLDILQRKLVLDQQMYYGKPDYSSDKAGAAALKDEQDRIDAKEQEISDAQKKIEDLQAKINATATDSSGPAK